MPEARPSPVVGAVVESVDGAPEHAQAGLREGHPEQESLADSRRDLSDSRARRVVSYIEANFATRIRVRDLAGVARLSNRRFPLWFHKTFGLSPVAYLARFRMLRAKQLMLKDSARLLYQIAHECGMCDQAQFSRVFRRVFGMPPKHWRQEYTARSKSHSGALPKPVNRP